MKGRRIIGTMLVWVAAVGFFLPQSMLAAPVASEPTPGVIDVALADGGVLHGQVVDPQGICLENVPMSVRHRDREVAITTSGENGRFAVENLRGGVYQLVAPSGGGVYRLWTPGTAPPASRHAVLVVVDRDTVRGQYGGALRFWLSNPWVIAAIVATAVAVPVAIHNSRRTASP